MLRKILEAAISLFRKEPQPYRGTGALRDEPDYRDITAASFQGKEPGLPASCKGIAAELDRLPILDQGETSSCVPHAIAMLLMAYVLRKTGREVMLSPRSAYRICKAIDGHAGPGTYPRVGGIAFTRFGCATEDAVRNDTGLSEKEYLDFELTRSVLSSCAENRMPGFAYVNAEREAVKQAIFLYGAVTASSIPGDWSRLPLGSSRSGGAHYTLWHGYEEMPDGDLKIYIRNSWGPRWLSWLRDWHSPGEGYFLWSECKDSVEGIIAFADIPSDYLAKVKKMPYRFTREMGVGNDHPQVRELQRMLNEDPDTAIALDGPGSPGKETSHFGLMTKAALVRWQKKHAIDPATGYFGPKSLRKANERIGNVSRIRDWALAIKRHEGYFPGSRSYRNRNPGNIRYSGIFRSMATGQDDKAFCVFATYEDGLNALETLLLRACTGLSSVYRPSMTLSQFYAVYAPSADDNDPDAYARSVASQLGVTVDTRIGDLV